jgi:hypothetical protein
MPPHTAISNLAFYIERLQPPPVPRPVVPQCWVTIVYLAYQVKHRLPTEVPRDFRANLQIDSGNDEIPSGLEEPSNISQALLREWRRHVAEKVIRQDDVLRTQVSDQLWICHITDTPGHARPDPRFDSSLFPAPLEDLLELRLANLRVRLKNHG